MQKNILEPWNLKTLAVVGFVGALPPKKLLNTACIPSYLETIRLYKHKAVGHWSIDQTLPIP